MGKITLTNIAEELAARSGMTKEASDNFVRSIVDTIERGLQEDSLVKIKGLGTFKLMEVSERGSVDVNTGERITIKGYRKVTFTPDSAMKEFVNRPFAHFEPTELHEGYPNEEEENEDCVVETTEPAEQSEFVGEESVTEDLTEEESTVENTIEEPIVEEESVVDVVVTVESAPVLVGEENVSNTITQEGDRLVDCELTETGCAEDEALEQVGLMTPECSEQAIPPAADLFGGESIVHSNATSVDNGSPKAPKRNGLGCLIIVLLIVLAYGAYHFMVVAQREDSDVYDGPMEEFSDIVVNPNLEEELGREWDDDPEQQPQPEQQPALQEAEKVVGGVAESSAMAEQSDTLSMETNAEILQPMSDVTGVDVSSSSGHVVLVEALEAKSLKDITIADTTAYAIGATLVTHQLKSGETIILLSKKYYGDKRLWPYIVKHNKMNDYNNVAIGQIINIPLLKEKVVE